MDAKFIRKQTNKIGQLTFPLKQYKDRHTHCKGEKDKLVSSWEER